jgi:glycerol-3-phosphate dehydrogenase (NAD(P)+)
MNILVIGAGAWGTALSIHAARLGGDRVVTLWARDEAQAALMHERRVNEKYLPGIALPPTLNMVSGDWVVHAERAQLVVVASPSSTLEAWLKQLNQHLPLHVPVAWLSKGFIRSGQTQSNCLAHEIAQMVAPGLRTGVFSGPSFAQEVATGCPGAVVAASQDVGVSRALIEAFHGGALRVYANTDVIGVEAGGAVKNVLAIATGLCDGLGLGLNARAALITRGLAEMTRLGLSLGARMETFMGLSGLGDLVLTATGDLSRNRQIGLLLAKGLSLEDALAQLGHVAEGVRSAAIVLSRAHAQGVEMPITSAVVRLLGGQIDAPDAVAELMGRQARSE